MMSSMSNTTAIMCCNVSQLLVTLGGNTASGRVTFSAKETSYTCIHGSKKAEVATLQGVAGEGKALMCIRRYRSLL